MDQILLPQRLDARSLDLLSPHVPAEVGMATHKVWMNVGSMPSFKPVNVELAEKALVLEGSKVGWQDLVGKDLNVGDLKAVSTGKPLNSGFKDFVALNALQHFVDPKGKLKGCGLWVVERKNESVSELSGKSYGCTGS